MKRQINLKTNFGYDATMAKHGGVLVLHVQFVYLEVFVGCDVVSQSETRHDFLISAPDQVPRQGAGLRSRAAFGFADRNFPARTGGFGRSGTGCPRRRHSCELKLVLPIAKQLSGAVRTTDRDARTLADLAWAWPSLAFLLG